MASSQIVKKFFAFSIGTWGGAVIGVILVPMLTHFFTPEEFGKASMFTMALNISVIFALLGTDQAFVRFYYQDEPGCLLGKCLKISFVLYVILSLFILIFRIKISNYLFGNYYPHVIAMLVVTIAFFLLTRYSQLIIRMQQKGLLFSSLELSLRLFDLFFIVCVFYLIGETFLSIIVAKMFTYFVLSILSLYFIWKTIKDINFLNDKGEHTYKDIVKYSFPLAFTTAITWVFQATDRLALNYWASSEELGVYVSAFSIVLVLSIIHSSFSSYWIPLSLEKFVKNKRNDNLLFFEKANGVITLIILCACVGLIIVKDGVVLILGKNYSEAVTIIPLLVFGPLMKTVSESTGNGIRFYKKVYWTLIISVITCIINVIGNYFLVPLFGGQGAAISTAISFVVFFILRTHISRYYYRVNFNLKKFYTLILLLFLYSLYSSFYDWSIYNFVAGVFVLFLIILFYLPTVKLIVDLILSYFNGDKLY